MEKITIIEHNEIDLANSLLLVAFPTVGLISSIAGHHIVQSLKLEEIGAIISDKFMPTTVIQNGKPLPPVRIYAGKKICGPDDACDQIAVIMSEFLPPYELIKPLVDSILSWAKKKKCRFVIGLEGTHAEEAEKDTKPALFGVISQDSLKETLEKYDIKYFEEGMITGVTGVMLYSAALEKQDALCLLAAAHENYPDSRAAAAIVEKLDIMLPGIKIDPKPLYESAEEIEKQIKQFMEQSKPTAPNPSAIPLNMYR